MKERRRSMVGSILLVVNESRWAVMRGEPFVACSVVTI